jgi:hypothetical protein
MSQRSAYAPAANLVVIKSLRRNRMAAKMVSLSPPTSDEGGGTSEMSALLLLLGVVTTAAGLAVVAAGVTIHDGIFGGEVLTPGTIAAVGGLLLVGMGLAVRGLRRIEHLLAIRPPPRASISSEPASPPIPEVRDMPPRVPFPSKPRTATAQQPAEAVPDAAATVAEHAALENLRATFPTWARLDNASGSATADRSTSSATAGESRGEDPDLVGRGGNGVGPARALPQLEPKIRLAGSPGRPKARVPNAFWPVGSRRDSQAAAAQVAMPLPSPTVPSPFTEAIPGATPASGERAAAAPSILKSGVVEGMAYTLFSDGSIEAQLPHGTVRFGSITELRAHIENNS